MNRLALAVTAALGLSAASAATCTASSVFEHKTSTDYTGGKDGGRGHLSDEKPRATWTGLLGKFKAKFGGGAMTKKLEAMKTTAAAWARHAHAKRYAVMMATSAPACR